MANLSDVHGKIFFDNFDSEERKQAVIDALRDCFDGFSVKGDTFSAVCFWTIAQNIEDFDCEHFLKGDEAVQLDYYEAESTTELYQSGSITLSHDGISSEVLETFEEEEAFNDDHFAFYRDEFNYLLDNCLQEMIELALEDRGNTADVEVSVDGENTTVRIGNDEKVFPSDQLIAMRDDFDGVGVWVDNFVNNKEEV